MAKLTREKQMTHRSTPDLQRRLKHAVSGLGLSLEWDGRALSTSHVVNALALDLIERVERDQRGAVEWFRPILRRAETTLGHEIDEPARVGDGHAVDLGKPQPKKRRA